MRNGFRAIIRSEKGATAVEYGLIVALIVLAVMVSIIEVASKTSSMWSNVSNEVTKR